MVSRLSLPYLFLICIYIYERVFCSPVWPPVHYVADLELLIFLPSSPECWYYKSVLPHMVFYRTGDQMHDLMHAKQALCMSNCVPNLSFHLPQASHPRKCLPFFTWSPCLLLENPSWSRVYDWFIDHLLPSHP